MLSLLLPPPPLLIPLFAFSCLSASLVFGEKAIWVTPPLSIKADAELGQGVLHL